MPAITPPPIVAAFDFDGTLTRGDSLLPFLRGGLGWPRLLAALLRCSPWLVAYALCLIPNHVAKAHLLRVTLGGRSTAEMQDWTERWLVNRLPAQLRDGTMARLAWHRQAGHCCVMVSASPDIYLKRVAEYLNFDALICTELEQQGGVMTGRLLTPNCYGEQKVLRLQAWLAGRYGPGLAESVTLYAYGDTSGDKPMLRLASRAWYRGAPWNGG